MGRKPHNMRPVEAFRDGVSLGVFESTAKAGKMFGLHGATVSKIVNGIHSQTRTGIIFKTAGEPRPPVTVWRKGVYIGTFEKAVDASQKTGVDHKTVSRILRGESSKADGFSFDYDVTGSDWKTCAYPPRSYWGNPVEAWRDGAMVCTFSSVSRAERTMGVGHGTIKAILGGSLEASRRGFVFKRPCPPSAPSPDMHPEDESAPATNPTATPPLPIDPPEDPQTPADDMEEAETETAPAPVAQDGIPENGRLSVADAPVTVWQNGVLLAQFPDMIAAGEAFGMPWTENPSLPSCGRRGHGGTFFTYNFSGEFLDCPRMETLRRRSSKPAEAWKDGELVCTFGSLSLASTALGFRHLYEFHACNYQGKPTPGGYVIRIVGQKTEPQVVEARECLEDAIARIALPEDGSEASVPDILLRLAKVEEFVDKMREFMLKALEGAS